MKKVVINSIIPILLLLAGAADSRILAQSAGNKLSFIAGEWQGTGWMMTRNGKEFSSVTEKAECKQNCSIIVVTGLGTKTDSLTNEIITVHDAFGIITYDKKTGEHFMRAYKNGEVTESEIEFIAEKIIRWSTHSPTGGAIRFTADFSEPGKWKERGEFSREGTNWMRILEMELEKKK